MADYDDWQTAGMDDDDDSGADYAGADYEAGAPRRRAAPAKPNLAKMALGKDLPSGVIGFQESVAASASENATSNATVPTRPTRLVPDEDIADLFDITAFNVGRVNLVLGTTNVPLNAFVQWMTPPISAPKLPAAINVILGVTNRVAAAVQLAAALFALDLSRNPASP